MNALSQERCFTHRTREAAARCPQCSRYYCRECVTAHAGRMVCAACLRQLTARPTRRRRSLHALRLVAGATAGLVSVWLLFYCAGRLLMLMPTPMHEGTLWESGAGETDEE